MENNPKRSIPSQSTNNEKCSFKQTVLLILGIVVILILLLILIISNRKVTPHVFSLSDNWDTVLSTAREKQSDVYLVNIGFDITPNEENQLSAEFRSKEKPELLLVVNMTESGKISTNEVMGLDSGDIPTEIKRKDWAIDSNEALAKFLQQKEVNPCLNSRVFYIGLDLQEGFEEPLMWEIIFWGCPDYESTVSLYLDPISGSIFDPFE